MGLPISAHNSLVDFRQANYHFWSSVFPCAACGGTSNSSILWFSSSLSYLNEWHYPIAQAKNPGVILDPLSMS